MNLLDDGVVDTFGSVRGASGVHTCVSCNAPDDERVSRAVQDLRERETRLRLIFDGHSVA